MIVGETILASDNYVLATENDAFTFTAVGLVAALNTGLFVYFIFNASEKMYYTYFELRNQQLRIMQSTYAGSGTLSWDL